MIIKQYLARLKNPATVLAIVGYVITILFTMKVQVDSDAITVIATSVCGICILLGIMNNPETKGIDLPTNKDKKQ